MNARRLTRNRYNCETREGSTISRDRGADPINPKHRSFDTLDEAANVEECALPCQSGQGDS